MDNGIAARTRGKLSFVDLVEWFILFAFLLPRGYIEYSQTYKLFSQLCTWAAVGLALAAVIIYAEKVFRRVSLSALAIALYFVLTAVITLFSREIDGGGLQQLFAYPVLCLYVVFAMRTRPAHFLLTVDLLCLLLFGADLFVGRSFFAGILHMSFLGHVQMVAQLGIVSLYAAACYWMLYRRHRVLLLFQTVLTFYTLLTADADSAVLTAALLLLFGLFYLLRLYDFLLLPSAFYLFCGLLLSATVIYVTAVAPAIGARIGLSDLNGRRFIWEEALRLFRARPLFGYGIDGVKIRVFWSAYTDPGGFNYAHAQLMQNLLDGGIVLTVAFWGMLYAFCRRMDHVQAKRYRAATNAMLTVLMIVSAFDAFTIYCYGFLFFAMVTGTPYAIGETDNVRDRSDTLLRIARRAARSSLARKAGKKEGRPIEWA